LVFSETCHLAKQKYDYSKNGTPRRDMVKVKKDEDLQELIYQLASKNLLRDFIDNLRIAGTSESKVNLNN